MAFEIENDAVNWYMSELTSRVVAESGIPSDRFHLGKIILRSLKDYPDRILQIDGGTGEEETNRSVLEKSVKCAECFRKFGLEVGDTIVLMAPSHLALCVPMYAGMFTGVAVALIVANLGMQELKNTLNMIKPKIIFCQTERASDVQVALNLVHLKALIVTFDKGEDYYNFSEFNQEYGGTTSVEDFNATDFDPENTVLSLTLTSGTTGSPKAVKFVHRNFAISVPITCSNYKYFPTPVELCLLVFPPCWMTGFLHFLSSAIFNFTRLQSSKPSTRDHIYDLIKTYKPTDGSFTPTFINAIVQKHGRDSLSDFNCFKTMHLCGSPGSKELIEYMKVSSPNTIIFHDLGMTETAGTNFHAVLAFPESCGKPTRSFEYQLKDIDTLEDIDEPNVAGELWLKGPSIFKGYLYSTNEAREEVFTHDGWFRTGDIFYRDINWHFFFVERIRLVLRYKGVKISPVEIEEVIKQHPGVLDVVVTSVPDPLCEDLLVACVIRREGSDVTADSIKNIVKDSLSDVKQLRGGVIFMDSFPLAPTTKADRVKIKDIAKTLVRQ